MGQRQEEQEEVRTSHAVSRKQWAAADHERGFQRDQERAATEEAAGPNREVVKIGEEMVRTDISERRRRGNQRPMYEFQRRWPAARATGEKGQDEFPMVTPSASMQDVAWGCMHNTMHEHAEEAELRPMRLHNVPPARPRQEPVAAQQPYTSQEYRDGWHPKSVQDLFQDFVFTAAQHGKWVTRWAFKKRQAATSRLTDTTEFKMSASEIVDMLEAWVRTNAEDIQAAEKAETDGSQPYTFRARAATLIVPEEAFVPMARRRVYDTSEWYKTPIKDRHGGLIKLVDVGAARQQHWQVEKLREWAVKSGCPDEMGVQQITGAGIAPEFTGEWSIVLSPNAKSYLADIQEGQAVEREEIEEGLVSKPIMGLPMLPIKVHPRSIAVVWRGDKTKKRVVGNMTSPHDEEMEHHSPNAGFNTTSDDRIRTTPPPHSYISNHT